MYIFYFQAEDGIRNRNVTGVQTCALPIYEDDETEVENSDDESDTVSSNVKIPKHSVSDLCKIIRCGPAQSPELDAVIREYFTKRSEERRVGEECNDAR